MPGLTCSRSSVDEWITWLMAKAGRVTVPEGAVAVLPADGEQALVETLAPGLDVTVPILGGPIALHPVAMRSELREGISTERRKRHTEPGLRGSRIRP